MDYLLSYITFAALLLIVIFIVARGKTSLWRWLFALEVVLLFLSLSNCFVPGSWKLFWETELPYLAITFLVAYSSSRLRVSAARRENPGTKKKVFTSPQMISFYCVLGIVALIVVDHP